MKYYVDQRKKRPLHTVKRREANWIGHDLRENRLLKHAIEGKIQGMRRRGRGHKHILYHPKEKGGYWNLKERMKGSSLLVWLFRLSYFFHIPLVLHFSSYMWNVLNIWVAC